MAQFKFLLWLAYWYQQAPSFEFDWDHGNSQKSFRKHDVGTDEIESLFKIKMAICLGRQIRPAVSEERLCIIGPSKTGRIIFVVFTLRENRIRPISGRPASRKERLQYEEISQEIKSI